MHVHTYHMYMMYKGPFQSRLVVQRQLSSPGGGGEGWRRLWREQHTPWDLGQPTPALCYALEKHLPHRTGYDNDCKRILVPGCGSGWDLSVLRARFPVTSAQLVALDVSDVAIHRSQSQCPTAVVRCEDFFQHLGSYDLVFINPSRSIDHCTLADLRRHLLLCHPSHEATFMGPQDGGADGAGRPLALHPLSHSWG
jgi:hypothetical protein